MTDPYSTLGRFVIESFFADDKRGDVVFPIIDEYFMGQFCKINDCSIKDFFCSVQKSYRLYYISASSRIEEILGLIAIQLYAASKMETSGGYSSSNFRNRICADDVLGIDVNNDWQRWVEENQEDIWERYYEWCNHNSFIILNKCYRRTGKDRYVQYPKVHASLILNRQDLKSIAYNFVEKGLCPNEDLTEKEFWSIIGKYHEKFYYSNRATRIINSDRDMANEQIYQYFLLWRGEYLTPGYYDSGSVEKTKKAKYYINLFHGNNEEWFIDIMDIENGSLIKEIQLTQNLSIDFLKPYYTFKRNNVIVFQKDSDYACLWNETRYVENYDSEALLLEYIGLSGARYSGKHVIASIGKFRIVRITPESYGKLYGEKRPYSIVGGFKVNPSTYMVGAPPLLITKKAMTFWIDGERFETRDEEETHILHLDEGIHQIKIRGYKAKEICMVDIDTEILPWSGNPRWSLNRHQPCCWQITDAGDVTGMDFSHCIDDTPTENPLKKWCKAILFSTSDNNFNLSNLK